ncbi:hypothetical protein [Hymenobacter convexus]|uniref:hypothetical protein n=1 Tax=Hymenobacter sp. CA1UV-4 TaxID=3063782 RepID=UPI002713B404|nr:hypothetical protein [Hymenobacter sp. CA1UV-4]MDO7853887.1 hypothetical protein [Hymenobacter sp. CA1UV-4]
MEKQDPKPLNRIANVDFYRWQRLRFFNNVDWCYNWQGNCLPEIIIHGSALRAQLNDHYANMTGNPDAVREFFNGTDWPLYFPILADEEAAPFLARLRSGECDIKRLDYETQSFYYAGAGELTPSSNEMVLQLTYAPE